MDATARARGIVARSERQQERFEAIVATFREGYHAGLDAPDQTSLARRLEQVDRALRGFAYEGAAMALVAREALNPWRRPLLAAFLAEHGERYTYLMHVGAGWAFGWVPGARRIFSELDPLLRWLAIDGMGFRDYFFAAPHRRASLAAPAGGAPYEARAFDQGVGRCLWFVAAAQPEELICRIGEFAPARRADLWAGVGLAMVYAGEPAEAELQDVQQAAGPHAPALAQGAAFAAKALECGGQLEPRHDTACGMPAREAARVTDEAQAGLSFENSPPAYESWRQKIQKTLAARTLLPSAPR